MFVDCALKSMLLYHGMSSDPDYSPASEIFIDAEDRENPRQSLTGLEFRCLRFQLNMVR